MFEIGDVLSVGAKGICELIDIKKNAFDGADKEKKYLVLKPVVANSNMIIYLPVDTKTNIRKLVAKNEAEHILVDFKKIEEMKVSADDDRLKTYNNLVLSGDFFNWLKLLKTLSLRKLKLPKKQFSAIEQKYLQTVQNCVVNELCLVLNKTTEEILKNLSLDSI